MKMTKKKILNKNRFKSLFSLLLSIVFILSLVSCSLQDAAESADGIARIFQNETEAENTSGSAVIPDTGTESVPESDDLTEAYTGEADGTETDDPEKNADIDTETGGETSGGVLPDENGYYYDRDSVVLFLYCYGHLPDNYITKKEASGLGWEGGSVQKYKKGAAIGGDRFGNREGLLPKGPGYTECDIDTDGASSRGAKRLIFSDDGRYYYTEDHYKSFTELTVDDGYNVIEAE